MPGTRLVAFALPLLFILIATPASSQDVYWHLDPTVTTCSMAIDASLTQAQWAKFTREASEMVTFKSLALAEPLGTRNVTVGLDYSRTPVDQHDPAWINTFVHPDADCPLGDQIVMPTLRARAGVSSRMDVGALWTKAPGANYGLVGGEIKYALLTESARVPAAAVRTSAVLLTGVRDFNMNIYSLGLVASKRVAQFSPYVGFTESLAIGTETTTKVALEREKPLLSQGSIGVACSVWRIGLAAEYNISDVNTLAVVIGSR